MNACGSTPQAEKYCVFFYVDGSEYYSVETRGNERLTFPTDPVKDTYDFNGWYLDDGTFTNRFDEDYLVNHFATKNINVYASFTYKYSELSNFEFYVLYDGTCSITAIKDDGVTEIVIPNYVSHINGGALATCPNLVKLTVPFVGDGTDS